LLAAHLASLEATRAEIVRLQAQAKDEKQALDALIHRLAGTGEATELRELAWYMYWETSIATESIGALLGCHHNGVANAVGGYPSGYLCRDCRTEYYWSSRSDRDGRKHFIHRECLERSNAEFRAEWDGRQEEKAAQIEALRTMPYKAYLLTSHWQEVRQAALKRAKFRCQVCNGSGLLDVHHRTYERRGDELPRDVIVLCRGCHQTFHDQRKLTR
jgi:5-methylcytosine-specific restriction endonuclease McrA